MVFAEVVLDGFKIFGGSGVQRSRIYPWIIYPKGASISSSSIKFSGICLIEPMLDCFAKLAARRIKFFCKWLRR